MSDGTIPKDDWINELVPSAEDEINKQLREVIKDDEELAVIRGEIVRLRDVKEKQWEVKAKQEASKKTLREDRIQDILSGLWYLLDLYKGSHMDEKPHRQEIIRGLFQSVAIELTGDSWYGEEWT